MIFNTYALINLVNSFCGLSIAAIIFFRRGRKPIQIVYGLFSLLLFFYGFLYWIWATQAEKSNALFWIHILMYPVSLIHPFYLHFTLVICDKVERFKYALAAGYVSSVIFAGINLFDGLYDLNYVRSRPPFLYWPHASPALILLILFQLFCIFLSFYVLFISAREASGPVKVRYKYLLIAGIAGWMGALTNWFHFYDSTPIPPFGNPMISIYLIFTFYLIFKHDLLDLNMVVKKTFVYAMLTLVISLVYALFVALSERLFQSYFGYSSFIGSVLAALTIAMLFNPFRDLITKWVDKNFFGKSIQELSQENIQMRNQLLSQDRMKAVATLAAGMAHEIKNPLTAIKTFTEHLPSHTNDPSFIKQFTRIVGLEVSKIDSIVRQLLEFSKPAPPTLDRINVIQVIEDTLRLLDAEFVKHSISVDRRYSAPLAWVNGDKKQLQQAFLNLLLNSIQAMPNGGKLEVTIESGVDQLTAASISDTGYGIAKENLSHIFDPFFTTKEEGAGLGLAITHGILKEHGCKVSVKSEENTGTSFKIIFNTNGR